MSETQAILLDGGAIGRAVARLAHQIVERDRAVESLVLVDRGNREVPIRADFVGQNVPGTEMRRVHVRVRELDGRDEVALL